MIDMEMAIGTIRIILAIVVIVSMGYVLWSLFQRDIKSNYDRGFEDCCAGRNAERGNGDYAMGWKAALTALYGDR